MEWIYLRVLGPILEGMFFIGGVVRMQLTAHNGVIIKYRLLLMSEHEQ